MIYIDDLDLLDFDPLRTLQLLLKIFYPFFLDLSEHSLVKNSACSYFVYYETI